MDDKTYSPEEVADQPLFPEIGSSTESGGSTPKDTFAPATVKERKVTQAPVARQLISDSLDTQGRRITNSFTFGQSGAIQVGQFEQGVSGDVKVSPNGIVARDQAGDETFSLDGTTGNATFKGTIQAGSLIAGDSNVVIDSVDGHGRILVSDGVTNLILIGYGEDLF